MEREDDGRWAVRSRRVSGGDGGEESEVYDAVVICNGHFTEPRVAEIPGILFLSMFTLFSTSCYC